MNGHKRADVRTYCDQVFLPLMATLDVRMVHWDVEESEGPGSRRELKCKDPELKLGEKRVIPVFQDESSFHVNEYKSSAWYAP